MSVLLINLNFFQHIVARTLGRVYRSRQNYAWGATL